MYLVCKVFDHQLFDFRQNKRSKTGGFVAQTGFSFFFPLLAIISFFKSLLRRRAATSDLNFSVVKAQLIHLIKHNSTSFRLA